VLDLPEGITACLFDLDGVLTQTAKVHAKAWKQMFDEYLGTPDDSLIHDEGVEPYEGSVRFVERAREQGLRTAVVSSSTQCAVFEDAEAGVAAGRAGHFGQVVGVDRTGHAEALREHGADVVVQDLAELLEKDS
jgi:beta-phosphoglucomutase-like phosphatase (HAD superfamily)